MTSSDSNESRNPTRNPSSLSISEQLSLIQRLQEDALLQKDQELKQLRNRLEGHQRDLSAKDAEIKRLERETYQQQGRILELERVVRRGVGSGLHAINPYQDNSAGEGGSIFPFVARIYHSFSPYTRVTARQPLRLLDFIHGAILFLFLFHIWNLPYNRHAYDLRVLERESMTPPVHHETEATKKKPWESTPPKPIALMDTHHPFIERRHTCILSVRERQKTIFEQILGKDNRTQQILLVDPAYHANVGDHMLTLGELELIETTLQLPAPQQCHYIQANYYFEDCTKVVRGSGLNSHPGGVAKVALWHSGGNWGDLWRDAQNVRIPSVKTLLENGYKVIGLPQSLFYLDDDLKSKDAISIKEKVTLGLGLGKERRGIEAEERKKPDQYNNVGDWGGELDYDKFGDWREDWDYNNFGYWEDDHVNTSALDTIEGIELAKSKVMLMWREQESFEEASQLYPFVSNMFLPDMAFQLGPYAPIRKHPDLLVDVIIFLREDIESVVQPERNEDSIRRMLPKPGMTFKIVDWSDRLEIFGNNDIFFTDTAIELLSLGKVVVCDRLHAAVLSYLSGLPFVYIDQVSGKVTKVLTGALGVGGEGCLDGKQARWARAISLEEALGKAADMIDEYGLDNRGQVGFLRGIFSFGD